MNPHHERIRADLRYLYRDAPTAMGLRSSFGAMVMSLEGGGYQPRAHYEVPDHRLEAAERARRIEDVLEALSDGVRVVLAIAHRYPDGEERLLACTSLAGQEHRRSRTKRDKRDWLERTRTSKDSKRRALWADLRLNAQAILEDCLDRYAQVESALKRQRERLLEGRSVG